MTVDAAPPTSPRVPPGHPLSRRAVWLVVAVVVWAVLLVVVAYVSARRDEPTVREQRSLAEAAPVVHRALGELVAAAGADVVVELSADKVEKGCRVTPLRDGAILTQAVTFRTGESDGPALLDRIAQRLPAGYRASTRHGRDGSTYVLRADAGEFVGIRGGVDSPGVVSLTVTTGCRPTGGAEPADLLPLRSIDEEAAGVLATLGATAVELGRPASAACPSKGIAAAAHAIGRVASPPSLPDALRPLAGSGAVVVVDEPDVYAYRSGPLSVVVEVVDHQIRVAITSGCPGQ